MIAEQSVAVVGAGPSGALTALLLARAGVDVTLIGRGSTNSARLGETLSPEGKQLLEQVDLWREIPTTAVTPCLTIQTAWEDAKATSSSFLTNPYGNAWHIDRPIFDRWLRCQAESSGARFIEAEVLRIARGDGGWKLDIRTGASTDLIHAEVLAVATGRARALTHGLGRTVHFDRSCAISGFAQLSKPLVGGLLIEAVRTGWFYSSPVPDGSLFVAFVTDSDLIPSPRTALTPRIDSTLSEAPNTRARLTSLPTFTISSASSSALDTAAGDQWIAIGDAALARDPLSGNGLASGLASAAQAARAILMRRHGDATAFSQITTASRMEVTAYLKSRKAAYRAQSRWPTEPFWTRRREAPAGFF